jgi:3-hydroxyisobutyrate dehydrogenase-like beta-hydroxyacid dehydrogenase
MNGEIEMEPQMSGDKPIACAPPARDGEVKPINLGFIGLGHMGTAMAANLAASGHRVTGYVRHRDRAVALAGLGILPTTEVQNLFNYDIVITMLPDDAAVRDVVFGREDLGIVGLASGLKRGAVHLCMATISTSMALQLATEHARCGQGYVAAPVFGNPEAAKARQLFILAAGAATDVERCRPLFDVLGQRMFSISAEPWQANLVKLLGNMMTATALEMMAELVTVARKRGLDPEIVINIMTSTMFGGRAHKIYGDKIVSQSYAPGFVLPLVLKDVRLALAEAEYAGAPTPSVNVVRDRLITGIARGYDGLDWTALGLIAGEEAGLDANNPVVLD